MRKLNETVSVNNLTKAQENYAVRNILDMVGCLKKQCRVFTGIKRQYVPVDKKGNVVLVEAFFAQHNCPFNKAGNITDSAVINACADELKLVEGKYTHIFRYRNVPVFCLREDKPEYLYKWNGKEYEKAKVYTKTEIDGTKWSARLIMQVLMQSAHIADEIQKSNESLKEHADATYYREDVDEQGKTVYVPVSPASVMY